MDDLILERLALIAIIIGLLILLFLMPYEFIDAHYLFEDDNNAFLEGEVKRITYNDESDWSAVEILSCREFTGFFEGKIEKNVGDNIFVKGSYFDDSFNINEYE